MINSDNLKSINLNIALLEKRNLQNINKEKLEIIRNFMKRIESNILTVIVIVIKIIVIKVTVIIKKERLPPRNVKLHPDIRNRVMVRIRDNLKAPLNLYIRIRE